MATPSFTEDNGNETDACTVDLPASIAAGDLLVVSITVDSNAGITTTATDSTSDVWNVGAIQNTTLSAALFWKEADGDEDSGTLGIVHTGALEDWVAQILQIPAADWNNASNPEFATWVHATSTQNPDPPAINPSWDSSETTFFGASLAVEDPTTGEPTPPSGYALGGYLDAGARGHGLAYKEDVVDSDDPGTWDLGAANAITEVNTFAVRLTQAGGAANAVLFRRRR